MSYLLKWVLSLSLVIGSLPVSASSKDHERLDSNRKRFQEAVSTLKADATIGDLFNAVAPLMTKQARADISNLLQKHMDKKAPQLELKGDSLQISSAGKTLAFSLATKGQEAVWMVGKKEVKVRDLKSPEMLMENFEKAVKAEMGSSKALVPMLILGDSAQAFEWLPMLAGAMIGAGLPLLFGASMPIVLAGGLLGAGAGIFLGGDGLGWFGNKSKTSDDSPNPPQGFR